MKDPLPKFTSFPAPRSGAVWAAPMPLPARGGPGLGVRVDEQGLVVTLQPRAERIERYVPSEEASGGGTFNHNWKPKRVDDTHLTISPSYCAGAVATIGGVGLDDATPPQLEVSDTDLVWVYLCVEWSLSYSVEGHVLPSSTVVSREITAESGELTDDATHRYFLLFQWQAGRVVAQSRVWNFEMDVVDNGTATSTPVYRTWVSA